MFVVALVLRALPGAGLLQGTRERLFGYDAYYHLRRVLWSLANFPESLRVDAYVQFPEGARPIWPPLFDLALATIALPFASAEEPATVERLLIWVPPVLGALTVVIVHRMGCSLLGRPAALAAAGILSVLSGHIWYSQLGFVDHHAAVALLAAALLAAGSELLRRSQAQDPLPPAALALGLLTGLLLWTWPGGLLHVALVQAGLLLAAGLAADPGRAARLARAIALADGVAVLCVAPGAFDADWPQWSRWSAVVMTRFQPALLALAALHALGCAVLASRLRGGWPRTAASVGLGAVALGVAALLLPGAADGVTDAIAWMSRDEVFQAAVGESRPLFDTGLGLGTRRATLRLSHFLWPLPVVLVALLVWARGRVDADRVRLLVVFTAGLLVATLAQRRFFNSLSIGLALASGWACAVAAREAGRALGRPRWATAGVGVVVLLLLAPTLRGLAPPVATLADYLTGEASRTERAAARQLRLIEAARWLALHSPPTAGWLDRARPEYGVLSNWAHGHVLRYVAKRPMAVDNFGDDAGRANFERANAYFEAVTEDEAIAILDELGCRYVVVEAGAGRFRRQLFGFDGSGLHRHRMVYETSPVLGGPRLAPIKVFERVEGARVVGRAAPLTEVTAQLELRSANGLVSPWISRVRADADGRFELRVPHPTTEDESSGLLATGPLKLRAAGARARVRVPAGAVQRGDRVVAPTLEQAGAPVP